MSPVIADTGPIVALLNARDEYHTWARETLETIDPPLLTCEPVLTEASHLVRKLRGGSEAVLGVGFRFEQAPQPGENFLTVLVRQSLTDALEIVRIGFGIQQPDA